ncbi:glycosyltransferase family 8 protein [Xylocopilactobacillus apicola]|uniref:Glucosyltransferase n=1 Tax=Xylocopilactobacillus apicola TaxID=2932184 RepID=A0AAU9DEK5_9LACO|nr:glycosyltransferase family 8 protein [Xylocopilactobacillus apicola]BDR59312.1 glucosyltransferase [Xylocopilactobacillus apicola]
MTKIIPIFYGINDTYAPYLAASLNSLGKVANPANIYEITIIYQELAADNITKLQQFAQDNIRVNFKQLENDLQQDLNNDQNPLRADFVTFTIYYRLFIADLFPQYDKAIYLDGDTVINTDPAKLYDQDLLDNLIGAVPDAFITHDPRGRKYARDALAVDENFYINSGVLLMNLKALRAQHFSEKFMDLLNKYHFKLIAPDQDYLNALCFGKTLYLDPRWDVQTEHVISMNFKPHIVHYNLFGKPWNYDKVPFEDLFWESSRETPYYDEVAKIKAEYSAEQKQHDQERQDLLIKRVEETPDYPVTFKKVLQQGVQIHV